jgi:hypothetical protein
VASFLASSFGIVSAEDTGAETNYVSEGFLSVVRLLEIVLDREQPFYRDENTMTKSESGHDGESWQRDLSFGDNIEVEHQGSYHAAQVILNDGKEIMVQVPGLEVEVQVPVGSSRIRSMQASTITEPNSGK